MTTLIVLLIYSVLGTVSTGIATRLEPRDMNFEGAKFVVWVFWPVFAIGYGHYRLHWLIAGKKD